MCNNKQQSTLFNGEEKEVLPVSISTTTWVNLKETFPEHPLALLFFSLRKVKKKYKQPKPATTGLFYFRRGKNISANFTFYVMCVQASLCICRYPWATFSGLVENSERTGIHILNTSTFLLSPSLSIKHLLQGRVFFWINTTLNLLRPPFSPFSPRHLQNFLRRDTFTLGSSDDTSGLWCVVETSSLAK